MPRVIGGRYGLSSKEFTPGMVAGVFAELARERPRRRFTIGINDDVSGTSLRLRRRAGHRAAGHRPRGVLRPGLGRDRRREQEHDQDPRVRGGPARPGLLRLRLEEVRLADRLAPALRAAARSGRPTSCQQASFVGCHQFGLLEQARRARPGRARRDAAAELPASRRTRSGTRCRARCRSRSWPRASTCTRSTPAGSPARSAWPAGSTSSCRPASSRSPACCRARRRSPGSRRRSPRPTASAARRSWQRNHAAVDRALEGLHRDRAARRRSRPRASCRRWCPRTRRSSCAPSPRR